MLEQLLANPATLARDLPYHNVWVARFYNDPAIKFDGDKPFIDQILALDNDGTYPAVAATYWDPHEEGYDGGPEHIVDCWRLNAQASTGQFCGWLVEGAFDKLSAIMAVMCMWLDTGDVDIDNPGPDFLVMAQDSGWSAPRPEDERDQELSCEIERLYGRLSTAAQAALIERLAGY